MYSGSVSLQGFRAGSVRGGMVKFESIPLCILLNHVSAYISDPFFSSPGFKISASKNNRRKSKRKV
jgi:hypothetical protein